jgi:hypothetical protein
MRETGFSGRLRSADGQRMATTKREKTDQERRVAKLAGWIFRGPME